MCFVLWTKLCPPRQQREFLVAWGLFSATQRTGPAPSLCSVCQCHFSCVHFLFPWDPTSGSGTGHRPARPNQEKGEFHRAANLRTRTRTDSLTISARSAINQTAGPTSHYDTNINKWSLHASKLIKLWHIEPGNKWTAFLTPLISLKPPHPEITISGYIYIQ